MAHPHQDALDRLGYAPIHAHMNITRQTFRNWRREGVPDMHRKTLAWLGGCNGKPMPEMELPR